MKLSVVIPTHNRTGTLRNTLAALAAQTLAADRFEVLVVDDGSRESERQALHALASEFNFELRFGSTQRSATGNAKQRVALDL